MSESVLSEGDLRGYTLEEASNSVIRKADPLCEFFCCGLTDATASTGDDRDTTFVQDRVGGLVERGVCGII